MQQQSVTAPLFLYTPNISQSNAKITPVLSLEVYNKNDLVKDTGEVKVWYTTISQHKGGEEG